MLLKAEHSGISLSNLLTDFQTRLDLGFPAGMPLCAAPASARCLLRAKGQSERVGKKAWQMFLEQEFWRKATGGHLALHACFPSLSQLLAGKTFRLFGISVVSLLGRGTTSAVYRTEDGHALKAATEDFGFKLEREYRILHFLRHPNLPRADRFFENGTGCRAMRLPLLQCGRHGNASDYEAGLRALHENGCLHGDLRPSNLGCAFDGTGVLFDLSSMRPYEVSEAMLERTFLEKLLRGETHFLKRI